MKILYRSVLFLLWGLTGFRSIAQVPELNSYSSSSAVIYLDFDGQNVSGTTWNINGPFTCNPSGISNNGITEIFNRVAEDYRPFNINITTSEAVFNAATFNKRIRIVITTSYEWYTSGVGGVAYVGSFTWGDNSPAFVFSSQLNYNLKNVAEAISHEAGHTLGLRHQSAYTSSCVKISDYNWGQGTGEIGWAPIMGAAYAQNLTLWHNGPNSIGCNNLQSDLDIITSAANGFGFRPDDHGNDFASATSALFTDSVFSINGVIEKSDDQDLFTFSLPVFSRFQLNAVPYNVGTGNSGSDLDLQVELLDGSHQVIGTYNPGNLLNSIVDTFMNQGTYFLRIDGKGNIYAPEYGSLGSYSLSGEYTDASILAVRKLELRGQLDRGTHMLSWQIESDENVSSQVLEVSTDGRNYISLANLPGEDRNYRYAPADDRPLRYRLHVFFDIYKQNYSNVITIRTGPVSKPYLIGNYIQGNDLSVSSPGSYHYEIFDRGGRKISQGVVAKGFSTVPVFYRSPGIYIIRFSNGTEQWTEKFFRY